MEKRQVRDNIYESNLDDVVLDRECVLKNNSIEKTAENIVKEMIPSIQLRMMNLSEIDKKNFLKMEIEKDDEELGKQASDYYFEYVSNKLSEDIENRCLNSDLWVTREEYKEKWKHQFPEEYEKMNTRVHDLSQEIASINIRMEKDREQKLIQLDIKSSERRLKDFVFKRKELLERFDGFLLDQMELDNEAVFEDLNLKVIKDVSQVIAKEASLLVKPYITKEVERDSKKY